MADRSDGMKRRRISVLGSTGSIVTSTVDLPRQITELIEARALVGGRNSQPLA